MRVLTIGRLADEVGINLETLRYYERVGLLPKAPRSPAGYRLFPADTARKLRFIKRAQQLGFSLKEIRDLLALRVSPRTTGAEIRQRAESKIADIEGKIRSLEAISKSLRKLTRSCARTGALSPATGPLYRCPILESLDREEA